MKLSGDESSSINLVRSFLMFATASETPSLEGLSNALDTLALAYHSAPIGKPADDEHEPPRSDYDTLRRLLSSRFPELGFYATIDDSVTPPRILTGDAIDDIADLVRDLGEVSWRFDHVSADDAYWHMRLTYLNHWGLHLRELSLHLHKKITAL
jgi:hypothetical protein